MLDKNGFKNIKNAVFINNLELPRLTERAGSIDVTTRIHFEKLNKNDKKTGEDLCD